MPDLSPEQSGSVSSQPNRVTTPEGFMQKVTLGSRIANWLARNNYRQLGPNSEDAGFDLDRLREDLREGKIKGKQRREAIKKMIDSQPTSSSRSQS